MFEVGDLVWYRFAWGSDPPVAAVITGGSETKKGKTYYNCRRPGWRRLWWGYLHQFESRACRICGKAVAEPGCPLCRGCIEEQREQEQGARAEMEPKGPRR